MEDFENKSLIFENQFKDLLKELHSRKLRKKKIPLNEENEPLKTNPKKQLEEFQNIEEKFIEDNKRVKKISKELQELQRKRKETKKKISIQTDNLERPELMNEIIKTYSTRLGIKIRTSNPENESFTATVLLPAMKKDKITKLSANKLSVKISTEKQNVTMKFDTSSMLNANKAKNLIETEKEPDIIDVLRYTIQQ